MTRETHKCTLETMRCKDKTSTFLLLPGLAICLFFGLVLTISPRSVALGYTNIVTPTPDPLAVPVMPESPPRWTLAVICTFTIVCPVMATRGKA